jgi:hypothetical protein
LGNPAATAAAERGEGKKIGLGDWFIGTRTFFRFRKG